MPEGGTLKIDVSQSIQPTGPYVTISVSDTGTGMPPEVRARLFEPFFTTKPKGTSTGLGLSAVHGLVTSLGGHIDVESEVGVGTTFTLSLPTASDNGLPCGRAAQQTLLLIEEDSFLRPLLVQGLKGAGFKVVAATTLADANQQLAAAPTPIDLIVLDTDASTNLTTLRSVREVYPNVPALVLSSTPEEADDEDRALMLSKPFKISEMASLASKLIAESAQDA
jgi:CheY-like chemotaxis protein